MSHLYASSRVFSSSKPGISLCKRVLKRLLFNPVDLCLRAANSSSFALSGFTYICAKIHNRFGPPIAADRFLTAIAELLPPLNRRFHQNRYHFDDFSLFKCCDKQIKKRSNMSFVIESSSSDSDSETSRLRREMHEGYVYQL